MASLHFILIGNNHEYDICNWIYNPLIGNNSSTRIDQSVEKAYIIEARFGRAQISPEGIVDIVWFNLLQLGQRVP